MDAGFCLFSLCLSDTRCNQRKMGSRMGAGLCEAPTKKGFSSDPLSPDPAGGPHSTPARLPSPRNGPPHTPQAAEPWAWHLPHHSLVQPLGALQL